MNEKDWVAELEREGYTQVAVCANGPDTDFGEHTHEEHTIHVILEGELTLTDETGSETLKRGQRFEIPAGTKHHAKCGPDGCTFVVGVKSE
ncbi:MAG TPA: cupin domain-containing protein [Candidatus Paceibacterota bacterium]|nr:cupin domain-containing protein [Candidatus Paceibacterota bacterium]